MSLAKFKRNDERPLVWAHRGAVAYYPENTLMAFEKALQLGADGIELDVHLSKDGKIVVIHDEILQRVSDGTGLVRDLTLEELKALDFSKTRPEAGRFSIPTLEEVFELVRPAGKTVNIEFKSGIVFYPFLELKVVKLTEQMGMKDQVLYSSFNPLSLLKIRKMDPEAYLGLLHASCLSSSIQYSVKHKINALHVSLGNIISTGFFEEAAEAGIDINPWTINDREQIRKSIDLKVNAMITDYPDKVLDCCYESGI